MTAKANDSRAICRLAFFAGLMLASSFACSPYGDAQSSPPSTPAAPTYRMNVAVDEVAVLFHASDLNGLPVNDLKLGELQLMDDGKPPRRVVQFQVLQDFPIRAAILIDTSASMEPHLSTDRRIAEEYTRQLLRAQTDQALVMDFGYASKTQQTWTNQPAALANAIRGSVAGRQSPLGGTALFDTIYKACFSEFGKIDHAASSNFILLFTDGEDNSSHVSAEEAIDACQHSDTAIYAFRPMLQAGASDGPKTLTQLAAGTGGRVFFDDEPDAVIDKNLGLIEGDLRNQYRLIFRPAELRHDGSFHHLELHTPDRVHAVNVRTGYYDRPR